MRRFLDWALFVLIIALGATLASGAALAVHYGILLGLPMLGLIAFWLALLTGWVGFEAAEHWYAVVTRRRYQR